MTTGDASQFYGPDYVQPGDGGDGVGPQYTGWDKDRLDCNYFIVHIHIHIYSEGKVKVFL